MKINIELNTKELHILTKETKEPIGYEFLINVYTEAKNELNNKEETSIYIGIVWALLTMLPSVVIHKLFAQWNDLVKELNLGLSEGKKVSIRNLDEELPK